MGGLSMKYYYAQYVIVSLLVCSTLSVAAKGCKSVQSLVVKCAITAAQLNVTGNLSVIGNAAVGGALSVSGNISSAGTITATGNITSTGGVVSDINGSIGNLTAYADFFGQNQASANTATPGVPLAFPTPTSPNTANITNNTTTNTFTITTPGTYQISYQVNGTFSQSTTLGLVQSTGGGPFNPVSSSQMINPGVGSPVIVGNTTLVKVAQGDQFQVLATSTIAGTIAFPPAGSNGTSITFVRVGN